MSATAKWLVGWLGTWFILSAMSEIRSMAEFSAALALAIATGATFVLGPDAAKHLREM